MKNKELIEKLQALDPEAEVITASSNFELRGAEVAVSFVHQYDKGRKETKTFVDAFDHESYEKEVFSIVGGNENVIYIS